LVLGGTAVAAACTSVALGGPTVARRAAACRAALVHYSAGTKGGLSTIPWIRVGRAGHAYLFLYEGELADGRVNQSPRTVIYTHGGTSTFSTKILWAPAHPGSRATLSGKRLDGAGTFKQRLGPASGGLFPSIVSVPAAGCWKLTLRTGKSRATIVVSAVDPPATPSCDASPVRRNVPDPIGGPLPWIVATPASAGIRGTIFYSLPADTNGVVIYPNKQAPDNADTKILWKVFSRTAGRRISVSALRLDAPGLVAPQRFPLAHDSSPGVSFPSIIDVSSTGCWLLTLRSGKAAAITVFQSVPLA
jgi:hypothetical protein